MSNEKEIAISVKNVSKSFVLPHEKKTNLKQVILGLGRNRSYEKQDVLKDISFDVHKGDFFGIVGRNGSGKSTLLKLLAEIYTPDNGSIQVNGKLTPFIELGVGFNPELTGRENVFLNGVLLGFTQKEIAAMYDDIVAFAELERFMDQKLKNYSSGMQVRLAFSIAIRGNADILVLDEVLAVGDQEFQQKCFEYFKYLKKTKKTVILVSHDQHSVMQFCNKAVYIEKGRLIEYGPTRKALSAYNRENDRRATILAKKQMDQQTQRRVSGVGTVKITNIKTFNSNSKERLIFKPHEMIKVVFSMQALDEIENPVVGMVVFDDFGRPIVATNSLDKGIAFDSITKGSIFRVIFEVPNIFDDGKFSISGAIANKDRTVVYARLENGAFFKVSGRSVTAKGLAYPELVIRIEN